MSAEATKITQKDFGCVLTGLVMSTSPTKTGNIMAVAAGDTMYKVFSKAQPPALLVPYQARMKGQTETGMFFEGERLS